MAGTTVKHRITAPRNSDLKAVLIGMNNIITDIENIRAALTWTMPGVVLTAPTSTAGTVDAKTWKTAAFTFTFRGKITSAASQEKAFTGSTHDVAASKQAWFFLTVQTNGTSFTITKAADQNIGTDVYPTGVDNEIIVAALKIVTGATGWVANTDDLAADGLKIASYAFTDAPAMGAAGLVAAKIGNLAGTVVTTQ